MYPTCVGPTYITYWMEWRIPSNMLSLLGLTYLLTSLNYVWNTYKLPVAISELGFLETPLPTASLLDIQFDVLLQNTTWVIWLRSSGVWEDGADVAGVLAWSWLGNWEFGTYNYKFDLWYNNKILQERSYTRSFFDLLTLVQLRRMKGWRGSNTWPEAAGQKYLGKDQEGFFCHRSIIDG